MAENITKCTDGYSIVVLGGGVASRLGSVLQASSKWLLPVGGRTLRDWQLEVLLPLADDILWAGGRFEDKACRHRHVRFVPDTLPVEGPLAGIHAGLCHARHDLVLVVPCDAPRLSAELLLYLVDMAREHPKAVAVVPRQDDGYWMPLLAVYRRACVPFIEGMAADNVPHVFRLFERLELAAMPVVAVDIRGGAFSGEAEKKALASFVNINTPEDYEVALRGEAAGEFSYELPVLVDRVKRW